MNGISTQNVTLGIDLSKNKFDVALLRDGKLKHKSFPNTLTGFRALTDWLEKLETINVHACMESTNIYGESLAEYLFDKQFIVSIVNPSRVKAFTQSELMRSKTDKADAGAIARFCLALKPDPWTPDPAEIRQLKAFVRRLDALIEMRQQEINRLDVASNVVVAELEEHIRYLDESIKEIKKRINDHIDNHPTLKIQKRLLESIPGVGDTTIAVVLSEFSNIHKFKNARALACYIGLTPRHRQSGTSVRSRTTISRAGRSRLRKMFFMPALAALRYNPIIVTLKNRLTEYGKAKMTIVGAAMRKLVHIIYGVLKNETPFSAEIVLK